MMKKLVLRAGIGLLRGIFFIMKLFGQDKKRIVFLSRESDEPSVDFRLLSRQL